MKKIIILFFLSIIFWKGSLYADENKQYTSLTTNLVHSSWYMSLGTVWAKLTGCNLKKCSYEDTTYGAILTAGYNYNKYIGTELRFMKTFLHKGPYGGTPLQHLGVFLKPQYQLTPKINMYTLLGYGYTENIGNGGRLSYFDNDSGFSAGFGAEYKLTKEMNGKVSIFLDYQRLLIKSDVSAMDMITLGIKYNF